MNCHDQPTHMDAPSMALAPALDASALSRLRQLDPTGQRGLLQRVLSAYRISLQRLRRQIDAANTELDNNELRMGVHILKSSSASVGALGLSKLCAAIEAAIRDDQMQALPALIRQTRGELDRVDEAVCGLMPN